MIDDDDETSSNHNTDDDDLLSLTCVSVSEADVVDSSILPFSTEPFGITVWIALIGDLDPPSLLGDMYEQLT